MEMAQKKQRIETDGAEGGPSEHALSPFNFHDLIIRIADKKLYINREDLIEVSPVFRTMLTADFKEKDARQIKLPDKDPTTFALFLRHTLPGFEGLILPGIAIKCKRCNKVFCKLLQLYQLKYTRSSYKPSGCI